MNRSPTLLLIAVALAVYGVYAASFVPGLLMEPPASALLIGFVLQAVSALAAAVGAWRGERWTTGALVVLGVSIACTWLFESFVLGIVAYLPALLAAALALLITFGIAVYINRRGSMLKT